MSLERVSVHLVAFHNYYHPTLTCDHFTSSTIFLYGKELESGAMSAMAQLEPEAGNGSAGLLQTLETSLDDLRSLITCRICIRPLYEPYTIECGHTFCYSCLRQWFDRDRTKKTCPDCRADVIRQPAPAYLVGRAHIGI